jgi:hypothetical protein
MRAKPLFSALINAFVVATAALLFAPGAWTQPKFKVLHNFTGGNDGGGLYSGLVFDGMGNLFGATSGGGSQ